MKRTLSWVVLAAIAASGLAACDKKPPGPSDGAVPTPSTTQPPPAPAPTPSPSTTPAPTTPSPDMSASSPTSAASS